MALDRFIEWQEKPTVPTIRAVLAEFLGSGFDLKWDGDRWFVSVPGEPSPTVNDYPTPYRKDRFIEIFSGDHLDVITRQADPITNAIADGLAEYLCFRLKGKRPDWE
jgi:hypothetical protein